MPYLFNNNCACSLELITEKQRHVWSIYKRLLLLCIAKSNQIGCGIMKRVECEEITTHILLPQENLGFLVIQYWQKSHQLLLIHQRKERSYKQWTNVFRSFKNKLYLITYCILRIYSSDLNTLWCSESINYSFLATAY